MNLAINLGDSVNGLVEGHSALNGATIPEGAAVSLSSSDPSVASVPTSLTVPPGGAKSLSVPVTVMAVGTARLAVTVAPADGSGPFTDTAVLTVSPAPPPALSHVTLTLSKA